MTFRFDEFAPNIAAIVAEHAEHARSCKATACERCGRVPEPEALSPEDQARRTWIRWARPALEGLPLGPDGQPPARLTDAWLVRLVGPSRIAQARRTLSKTRVLFVGDAGTGKTALAVAMMQAVLAAEVGTSTGRARHRFVSAHALAKARAGHPLGAGEAPLVVDALASPLLVIDELGGEDARFGSSVAEVIYERHARNRQTWITTGVATRLLGDRYGGGIARRITEGAEPFEFWRSP
ncbi:hypothetical protein AKJ09_09840 [Labilithrix luteola]|uniref:DNA replication protein DnaC n=1 Tax=Labilithrix luteola TaxID=1391654 RepID=A0A0K1QBX5_9BACT|nr:hypothetical protein [Labilithrix luteola]AKV03177.1 hypothetical protein AKJ09_09840 [Labilithrix luteola]